MAEITAADLREIFFSEDLIKGTEYEKNPKNFRLPVRWDGGDYYKELYLLLKEYRFRIETKFPGDEYKEYRDDIKFVCHKVCLAVSEAFHGNPSKAYDAVDEALNLLTEKYKCFMSEDEFRELSVYRVVDVNDNTIPDRKRVFHVPFNLRQKMSTTRYSIPGYPALYLGTSIELNCAETNKTLYSNTVMAARFEVCNDIDSSFFNKPLLRSFLRKLYIIDLSVKPQDYDDAVPPRIEAERYLPWYPLIAACSFIRVYRDQPFAAEYVVPQLVMQWAKKKVEFLESDDHSFKLEALFGVCYFSCLSEKGSQKGLNFAFPSSGDDIWVFDDFKNFCPVLAANFALTEPVYVSEYENAEACEAALNIMETKRIGRFSRDGIIQKIKEGYGSYEIPDGEDYIPIYTFSDCKDLEEIKIPDSVTNIGIAAFDGCTGLRSIDIPDSVTNIGDLSFYFCINLSSISIPASVTCIGNQAFEGCTGLKNISTSNSLTDIGELAFRYCTGLTSLTIPTSVIRIGYGAFCGCTGLSNLTIPDSVTSIGESAFLGCTGLTSLTIHANITKIEDSTFEGCNRLKSVTMPNSIGRIGDSAFYGCTGLSSIFIPNCVTSIGEFAFDNCAELTSLTIPNSVTNIGLMAFCECKKLDIIVPRKFENLDNLAFLGCHSVTYY